MSHELCNECGGEGQTGMRHDGSPIVCQRCDGDGCESSQLPSMVDANDDAAERQVDARIVDEHQRIYGSQPEDRWATD